MRGGPGVGFSQTDCNVILWLKTYFFIDVYRRCILDSFIFKYFGKDDVPYSIVLEFSKY